jgi:hypothetical protein
MELGDAEILTVNTSHIAVIEKDGPRSSFAYQKGFFSVMRAEGINHGIFSAFTNASFAFQSVYSAPMGTEGAIFINFFHCIDFFRNFLRS